MCPEPVARLATFVLANRIAGASGMKRNELRVLRMLCESVDLLRSSQSESDEAAAAGALIPLEVVPKPNPR
jgi:hypothetical protein